jgi:hypothetical protein
MIRVVGETKRPVPTVLVEVEYTPEELALWRRQNAVFLKNREWFRTNAQELYKNYAGRFICVAGGEVFAGDDAQDVYSRAYTVYPEERSGGYGMYIRANPVEGN